MNRTGCGLWAVSICQGKLPFPNSALNERGSASSGRVGVRISTSERRPFTTVPNLPAIDRMKLAMESSSARQLPTRNPVSPMARMRSSPVKWFTPASLISYFSRFAVLLFSFRGWNIQLAFGTPFSPTNVAALHLRRASRCTLWAKWALLAELGSLLWAPTALIRQ
ncbi:hypothetical protein D3C87_1586000 [compost metagenome]